MKKWLSLMLFVSMMLLAACSGAMKQVAIEKILMLGSNGKA